MEGMQSIRARCLIFRSLERLHWMVWSVETWRKKEWRGSCSGKPRWVPSLIASLWCTESQTTSSRRRTGSRLWRAAEWTRCRGRCFRCLRVWTALSFLGNSRSGPFRAPCYDARFSFLCGKGWAKCTLIKHHFGIAVVTVAVTKTNRVRIFVFFDTDDTRNR